MKFQEKQRIQYHCKIHTEWPDLALEVRRLACVVLWRDKLLLVGRVIIFSVSLHSGNPVSKYSMMT